MKTKERHAILLSFIPLLVGCGDGKQKSCSAEYVRTVANNIIENINDNKPNMCDSWSSVMSVNTNSRRTNTDEENEEENTQNSYSGIMTFSYSKKNNMFYIKSEEKASEDVVVENFEEYLTHDNEYLYVFVKEDNKSLYNQIPLQDSKIELYRREIQGTFEMRFLDINIFSEFAMGNFEGLYSDRLDNAKFTSLYGSDNDLSLQAEEKCVWKSENFSETLQKKTNWKNSLCLYYNSSDIRHENEETSNSDYNLSITTVNSLKCTVDLPDTSDYVLTTKDVFHSFS